MCCIGAKEYTAVGALFQIPVAEDDKSPARPMKAVPEQAGYAAFEAGNGLEVPDLPGVQRIDLSFRI